jgi:hypothetical protein
MNPKSNICLYNLEIYDIFLALFLGHSLEVVVGLKFNAQKEERKVRVKG